MNRLFSATLLVALASAMSITAFAQSESRDAVLKEIETKRLELSILEEKFLAPPEDDRVTYAEFLKQPNAGIIRLLPREKFESEVYKKNQHTLTVPGGGAYFSFTHLTHEYGSGTQLGLEQNYLSSSFAGADYGIISNLGDVPLEGLSLEYPTVKFMASYEAAREEPRARSEYMRFSNGLSIDGLNYKTRLLAVVNNSYALRGIHYSDSDVLVVFRIVRKDEDGSLILLWKLLKKYPKPELARANQPN